MISDKIRERIEAAGGAYFANDNIAEFIEPGELELLQAEVTERFEAVLSSLVIDVKGDHNTHETAKRVAKMYLNEVFAGRYRKQPQVTEFPNAKKMDETYTVGPMSVRSACSHHFVPILGKAWVGVVPGTRLIGLSKFSRFAEWILSRPHIQEEAAVMLADKIEELIEPRGVAVVIKANHLCMTWRGVRETNDSSMVTSVMRGVFADSDAAKTGFMDLIKSQGF